MSWDLFGGGTTTQTSTTIPISPNYTPEQLYWMNLGNQTAWGNILTQNPLAVTSLNAMVGTTPPVTLPYGMSEEQMGKIEDPYYQATMTIGGMDKADRDKFVNSMSFLQNAAASRVGGGTTVKEMLAGTDPATQVLGPWYNQKKDWGAAWSNIQKLMEKYNLTTDDLVNFTNQIGNKPNEFLADVMSYTELPKETQESIQSYIQATPEEREAEIASAQTATEQAAAEWAPSKSELETYLESLTPEKLEGAIASQEDVALRGAEDWYKKAQRDAQRRLQAQTGGYLGSTPETAFQTLDALYGRNVTDIQSQVQGLRNMLPAETSLQKLGVLSGLYGQGSNVQATQTGQWLPVASSYYNVPWGQQTTATSQIPSSGIIPTLSDLAGIGLGGYALGQGLGLWGGANNALGWWSNPSNYFGGAQGFGTYGNPMFTPY